jgi:hypothetical protein
MNTYRSVVHRFPAARNIQWQLLLFLVMFLNVKLAVKVSAVVLVFFLQPNFILQIKRSALSFFYLSVIGIAVINTLIYKQIFQLNYLATVATGILFWAMCLLALNYVKRIVDTTETQVIYKTLIAFFILNTLVCFGTYISIVYETGYLNPFRYQGNYQKYFISTGDYIKGISFDTSTTNAVLNAFGVILFLSKRNWVMLLMCVITLLFAASNFVNLILFAVLFFMLLFRSDKDQKSIIVVSCAMLAVFMAKVSPQNNTYATDVFKTVFQLPKTAASSEKKIDLRIMNDSMLSAEQQKEKTALLYLDSVNRKITPALKQDSIAVIAKINPAEEAKITIPQPNIHTPPFQRKDDTNIVRKEMMQFITTKKEVKKADSTYTKTNLPGKAIAYVQTGLYFSSHPEYWLTGAGTGNFSSKVAFKATTLQFAGGFPKQLAYIHPDFALNHLSLYLHFFTEHSKKHSVTNTPNSVYDQLLSEYGIIGVFSFFILYVGFFVKRYKSLTYGIPLLFMLLCFFFLDYWFEQLSVVTFCELLLLTNIKEQEAIA